MILNTLKALTITSALLVSSFSVVATPAQGIQPTAIAQNTQQVLASGTFVTVEQEKPTRGTARIVSENGKRYLEFDGAFTTAQGPDVQVVLHRSNQQSAKLKEGDYVVIATLKNFDGAQRYELPSNLKVEDFKSVGIWCRQFNVTFGYASL
ncbi:MAG: DM13 domain-containing protein [Oscillatoriales cyanobacterium RM1_1_9]|nr:DM13 domain-containing protein [Oscillatoriales cyanobacterium SM2_3_0]NJO47460.1 DM13 domain-containing protein [Oscillatoriales cyanobacterium RM2_1_1]NJO70856.1 DM13 domain-containing protein [Oscillatoriales cyanobacterium RM1_1_9]